MGIPRVTGTLRYWCPGLWISQVMGCPSAGYPGLWGTLNYGHPE